MTEAVLGLLDHLRVGEVVLLGHSFGGMVSTTMALEQPGRVQGLCLMNSSGFTRYPAWMHLLARTFFRPALLAPFIRGAVPHLLGNIFGERSARTERFLTQVLTRRDPRYAWEFAYYASPMIGDIMSDVLDRLDELTLPMLVLWGERDSLLPHHAVAGWIHRLPQARLLTLKGCGHMPNLERPDAVGEAMLHFMNGLGEARIRRALGGRAG
jgi:pimeloyl-ACP methyl ester carboxylesterase